jgi:chromosome partitioning protein
MRAIAITNQKGGSGKTTSTVNIAAALAEKGHRVLVIDLDPQASASAWFGVKEEEQGLLTVFTDNVPLYRVIHDTETERVEVVPASNWLSRLERLIAGEPGSELILRDAVAAMIQNYQNRWDFILFDCPPALGLLSTSALCAASEVVIPVEASAMAMAGVGELMKTIQVVRERLNERLRVTALIVCRTDSRNNLSKEVEESLRGHFQGLVTETTIRETVKLREAWSFSEPITSYDPKGLGAQDYRAVAEELLQKGESSGEE